MLPKPRKRVFQINDSNIQQVLFCDNSDTEDALTLDDEDVGFLEEDCVVADTQVTHDQDTLEVTIDPPNLTPEVENLDTDSTTTSSNSTSPPLENLNLTWKKINNSSGLSNSPQNTNYGVISIESQTGSEFTPYQIFRSVANFDNFITNIVLPQTRLYAQQQGHVFQVTPPELNAYFGITLVMGYHRLPTIRDYWSTEPDLRVPYVANVMRRQRFEEIRAFLHFNDNSLMKSSSDPQHDRAFKIRPVLDHFNSSFLAALSSTQFQSIDEHMIKFKGHNILRQYVKGKPIQWGFKMWCRCDSKTGYLFECDLYLGKLVYCAFKKIVFYWF